MKIYILLVKTLLLLLYQSLLLLSRNLLTITRAIPYIESLLDSQTITENNSFSAMQVKIKTY